MIAAMFLMAAASVPSQPEMQLRCSVAPGAPLLARNTPTLTGGLSGGPAATPPSLPLPVMMVEGWTVDAKPIGAALSELGTEAGFFVVADPGLGPVSWKGPPTSLATVVTRLAQAAGGVPSFDGKVLRISKPAPWMFRRPDARDATLALLDALRGYGATDVRLLSDSITFSASEAVVARVRKGLTSGVGILAFDVWTYTVSGPGTVDWKALDEVSPVSARQDTPSGGSFVTGYVDPERVATLLGRFGTLSSLGAQTVAGPQGWAVEVPLGQCAATPRKLGSVTLRPRWDGSTMSVEASGDVQVARFAGVAPGSTMIFGRRGTDGVTTVVVVRPRVLASR